MKSLTHLVMQSLFSGFRSSAFFKLGEILQVDRQLYDVDSSSARRVLKLV
jgi:hypothetical protein